MYKYEYQLKILNSIIKNTDVYNMTNKKSIDILYNYKNFVEKIVTQRDSNKGIDLSIIIPFYNSENYLAECLDSVIKMRNPNVEILCINDGSTDSSLSIAKSKAKLDSRIKIIDKKNTGYGDSLNYGLALANGKYIGIIESDDLAIEGAFEELLEIALRENVDVVKGNYNIFSDNVDNAIFFRNMQDGPYNVKINVSQVEKILYSAPSIWSAIYKTEYIHSNSIYALPTCGAAYQDTSFAFISLVAASSVYLIESPIVNYRLDNDASSSNSNKKIFDIFNETDRIRDYLDKNKLVNYMQPLMRAKIQGQAWNYYRLLPEGQKKFLVKWHEDAKKDLEEGLFNNKYWDDSSSAMITQVIKNPLDFNSNCVSGLNEKDQIIELLKNSSPLYIFGAGIRGRKIASELEKYNINIDAYVVSEIAGQENTEHYIINIQDVDRDGLIILGVSDKFKDEVMQYLKDNYINGNCVDIYPLLF